MVLHTFLEALGVSLCCILMYVTVYNVFVLFLAMDCIFLVENVLAALVSQYIVNAGSRDGVYIFSGCQCQELHPYKQSHSDTGNT